MTKEKENNKLELQINLQRATEKGVIDLGKTIEGNREKIQQLESQITSLQKDCESLQTLLHQANNDKDNLQETIQKKEDQVQKLTEKKTELENGLQNQIAEKTKEIEVLETKIKSLQDQAGETDAKLVNQVQTELSKKQNEFQELEKNNKELQENQEKLEDEIFALERQLSRQKSKSEKEKGELQEKIDDLKRKKEEGEKQLAENEEKRKKLREEITSLDSKIAKLKAEKSDELDQLTIQNSKLNGDWLAEKGRADRLNRELMALKAKLENSGSSNKDSEQVEKLQAELAQAKSDLQLIQQQTNQLKEELTQKEKDNEKIIDNLKKEIEDLKEKINKQQTAYQQSLIAEKQKNEESEKQLQDAKEGLQKNEEKVKELTEDLDKKQQELDRSKDRIRELEEKLQNNSGQTGQETITDLNSKIKELEKQIKDLKKKIVDNEEDASKDQEGLLKVIADLEDENRNLRDEVDKLKEGQQQDKLEETKSTAIAELETLMKGSDSQLAITADKLLQNLKDDGKLPDTASDWKEYIQGASNSEVVIDRKNEVKVVIDDFQRDNIISGDDLSKVKSAAISDIKKALNDSSLDEKEIIPDYQGYAEEIQGFVNEQEVKDFAGKVIFYLKACQELNNALEKTKKFVDGEIAFEFWNFHKTRRTLDALVEKNSLEAKQAYQTINKGDKVDLHREKIATQIWEYLWEEGMKAAKDPSNKEFLKNSLEEAEKKDPMNEVFVKQFREDLEKTEPKEWSEKFELYWIIREIVKRFSDKNFEEKEIPVDPYVESQNVNGTANVSTSTFTTTQGDKVIVSVNQKYTLKLNFQRSVPQLLATLPHELTHFVMYWLEFKELLPKSQSHSETFWKVLYYINEYPINDSDTSFSYLLGCLPPKKYQEFKDMADLSKYSLITNNRSHYFPELEDYNQAGIRRFKKYFSEDKVVEGWNFARKALTLANDLMNKNKENWNSKEEKKNHWVQMKVLHKTQGLTAEDKKNGKDEHKIYIFYDEERLLKLKEGLEGKFIGWENENIKEVKNEDKINKMCHRIEKEAGKEIACSCEVKNEQQEAKVLIDPVK